MRTRYGRISKDELRSICIAKGWTRRRDGKFSMDRGQEWLRAQGIDHEQVWSLVREIRAAARGIAREPQTVQHTTNVQQGIEREQVEQILNERLADVQRAVSSAAGIDKDLLAKLIGESVQKMHPHKIVLTSTADKAPVKFTERTHPVFEKTLRLVTAGLNVLLVGPAGCGKTTLGEQIAQALKSEFGVLSCTSGASESHLTGYLLPVGEGKPGTFTYVHSEFVRLYEKGNSVFLLDELDAADPNMLLVINSALANGALHVPQRHTKPKVTRGKNNRIIAAANTFGTGADMIYAGRNQLDAATLDRFYVIRMDYDPALEASFYGDTVVTEAWQIAPEDTIETDLQEMRQWIMNLRERAATHKLRRVVGTRMHLKAIAARRAGVPASEIRADLLNGWTRDELNKVGAL